MKLLLEYIFIIRASNAHCGIITLKISGRDAAGGNTVPLQSVKVGKLTHRGDTTVRGDAPTLVLQKSFGIFKFNKKQNAVCEFSSQKISAENAGIMDFEFKTKRLAH